MLQTNRFIEQALANLGTLVRVNVNPPANPDLMDATIIRTYGITKYFAKVIVPANAEIKVMENVPGVGNVPYIEVAGTEDKPGTRVHFHGGLVPKPGEYVEGDVHYLLNVWNRCRQGSEQHVSPDMPSFVDWIDIDGGTRFYGAVFDVWPMGKDDISDNKELMIYDCYADTYKREEVGRNDHWVVRTDMFANEVGYKAKRRDQHIAFVDVSPTASVRKARRLPTAMANALLNAGLTEIGDPAADINDKDIPYGTPMYDLTVNRLIETGVIDA